MLPENPRSTLRIAGHPLHAMLVPFPIACFVGTLITDIAYLRTMNIQWANFSAWLVSAGVVLGVVAALFGLVDLLSSRPIRQMGTAWAHGIGNLVVLGLSTVNMFVHTRDGWTSVMPWGVTLSALVVLILLFTGWMGWSLVYRHRVGVTD